MNSLDHDFKAGFLTNPATPCLSLYQPSHRKHPENQQDPIRFKNLVKQLEESLQQQYSAKEIEPLLAPFWKLADDTLFWNHTLDGLVVLGAPGMFRVYRVQRPVPELAIVADSFHIKPLLRILQSADRYQVLAISLHEARLYEGNRDSLDPVKFPAEVQEELNEALEGGEDRPRMDVWQMGGGAAAAGVRARHASGPDPAQVTAERFFRTVDRVVMDRYSRPSGLPLLLVAVTEHHTPFRNISRNPLLMDAGIENHPDGLSAEELRKRAWQVVEPHYLERLSGLIEMYGVAKSRDLGTNDIAEAVKAAAAGRMATLLIEADRQIPGRWDAATGEIELDDLANPDVDDLLDDLAELVLKNSGQVVIVPAERMPTDTGVAGIFRF